MRALSVIFLLALSFCSDARSAPKPPSGKLAVVTTMSTLTSFIKAVGGEHVEVTNLVPVGASPETYQPTPTDIATLQRARVLVENGAGLETWLERTVANAKNGELRVVVCSDGLPVRNGNPHLWMDPQLAQRYVDKIRDALAAADPGHRDDYRRGAAAYNKKLTDLERHIRADIATIPPEQRAMIVFHNAWEYYNARFGIRTIGVVELSPGQEPSPRYIGELVTLAKKNHVRAVFAEPEYSPRLVQALARSAGIKTVQNLYDDSLGTDPRVRDYLGMLNYDTDVIVGALK